MNYYNIYVIEFTATGECERYYSKGEMKNRPICFPCKFIN